MRSAKAPTMSAGCDDRKGHLEHHEHGFRNLIGSGDGVEPDAGHEGLAEPAYPGLHGASVGEGQAVAEQDPEQGDHAGDRKALHHDRQGVLGPHHAGVEQGQARDRHHQHQGGGNQHPGGIPGIDRRGRRGRILSQRRDRQQTAEQAKPAAGQLIILTHGSVLQ